jgi:hypothetical protein
LEKEVNENGVRCLPYPGKNSTIGKAAEWFDKEIQVLSVVIAKTKKFLCYCLARVLRMLYHNANCSHIEGLEAIMNSCNASILDDIPEDIGKFSGCIVWKWWALHGFPYAMDVFCIVPEVWIFVTPYNAWRLC